VTELEKMLAGGLYDFSDAEVEALLNHAGREEYLDDARELLEGYRFGRAYCSSPARVIGFLDRGCTAPGRAGTGCV